MKLLTACFQILVFMLVNANISTAATFDFVSYADGDADKDGHYEWGYDQFTVTEDNVKLQATGQYFNEKAWEKAYAYLDRGHAGLGVCKEITGGNQCAPSSDDNVTPKELLLFNFDQSVALNQVEFRNGSHGKEFDGEFRFSVFSDGRWSLMEAHPLTQIFESNRVGEAFAFQNLNKNDDNKHQFYVASLNVSAVPVPSAFWLFGTALLGMVTKRRKIKAAK